MSEDPDGRFLREAPAHIAADREVILAAVQRNGRALEFAAETLRADKETLFLKQFMGDGYLVFLRDYSISRIYNELNSFMEESI